MILLSLATALLPGCIQCGDGTHLDQNRCVADADSGPADSGGDADTDADTDADSDTDSDTDTDTDTDSDTDTDTDTDSDTDVDTGGDYVETGDCAPTDTWTGPVTVPLTTTPFDASYDANMRTVLSQASGGGSGTWSDPLLVDEATIVAISRDRTYTDQRNYYLGDGFGTVPVQHDAAMASVGDTVLFAFTGYEGHDGVPMLNHVGSWMIKSSGNTVPAVHLGAATVRYADHYSQLVHEAGELTETSSIACGSGYTCFIFEHDGVRDRIRLPSRNDFGLDADYGGGLCAEVIAPAGTYSGSGGGDFIDVADSTWMRVWDKP